MPDRISETAAVPREDEWPPLEEIPSEATDVDLRLNLLQGFELLSGRRPIMLSLGSERLLALLALTNRPLMRNHVAFTLWPDKTEERANGNLRSAVWRLRREGFGLIESGGNRLAISRNVSVDYHVAVLVAERILAGHHAVDSRQVVELLTSGDVLFDWYDDWIEPARERLRQLRLHALDTLCEQHIDRGDLAAAVEAGVAAVAAEPRRESSHRLLIRAHIAEGNAAEALRQYESYRFTAHSQLGILPSAQMEALVAPVRRAGIGGRS